LNFWIEYQDIFITGLLLLVAILYSSVGHAGASGYLAVMGMVGISAEIMRPTALALNIVVAIITTYKFYRSGSFSWQLFLPLIIMSIPMAYIGGRLELPETLYKPLVGMILLFSAWRLIYSVRNGGCDEIRNPSTPLLLLTGAGLGLLSGLTGVGGGVFLSPLLLFLKWAPIKLISGVTAGFVLVNSISGILGVSTTLIQFHPTLPIWLVVVVIGGLIGAEYGSKRLGNNTIQWLLAIVLVIAGIKMIFMI
jgi:uncharacterized membrane protein YfcA